MNIDPVSNIAASTEAMGELLKQMAVAQQGMDEKLLGVKAAEIAEATGTAGIDVTA